MQNIFFSLGPVFSDQIFSLEL